MTTVKYQYETWDQEMAATAEWAAGLGWELCLTRSPCATMLENPRHRCSSNGCYGPRGGHNRFMHNPGYNIDHPRLLRRGPAARPTQWALLSQVYDMRPGDAQFHVGLAPYGHGTDALLYVGAAREEQDEPNKTT